MAKDSLIKPLLKILVVSSAPALALAAPLNAQPAPATQPSTQPSTQPTTQPTLAQSNEPLVIPDGTSPQNPGPTFSNTINYQILQDGTVIHNGPMLIKGLRG